MERWKLNEGASHKPVELEYDDLEIFTATGGRDWDTGDYYGFDRTVEYTYELDYDTVLDYVWDYALDQGYINDDMSWGEQKKYVEDNFDRLFDEHKDYLKDLYREDAEEEASEYYQDYYDNYAWDESLDTPNESTNKRVREEMELNFDRALLDKWIDRLNAKDADVGKTYTYKEGGKYIKVIYTYGGHDLGSVFAFVDADGNIYKPAGWQAPAKGVRARIDDNPPVDGKDLYSARYLKAVYGENLKEGGAVASVPQDQDIITYKQFQIEHFPYTMQYGDKEEEIDAWVIKSPYYMGGQNGKPKYYMPLYCEDESGEVIDFNTLDQAKKYVDDYLVPRRVKIRIKNRDEVHAVVVESLNEDIDLPDNLFANLPDGWWNRTVDHDDDKDYQHPWVGKEIKVKDSYYHPIQVIVARSKPYVNDSSNFIYTVSLDSLKKGKLDYEHYYHAYDGFSYDPVTRDYNGDKGWKFTGRTYNINKPVQAREGIVQRTAPDIPNWFKSLWFEAKDKFNGDENKMMKYIRQNSNADIDDIDKWFVQTKRYYINNLKFYRDSDGNIEPAFDGNWETVVGKESVKVQPIKEDYTTIHYTGTDEEDVMKKLCRKYNCKIVTKGTGKAYIEGPFDSIQKLNYAMGYYQFSGELSEPLDEQIISKNNLHNKLWNMEHKEQTCFQNGYCVTCYFHDREGMAKRYTVTNRDGKKVLDCNAGFAWQPQIQKFEDSLLQLLNTGSIKEEILTEKPSPDGYEPTKKGIAYKVFKVKNGKLYPPMVANAGGADTPVGVWLDAEEGEFAGLSKTGRPQVKSTGSGNLSYRPGWHLGDVPRAKQFDRLNKETGEYEFPKDFVWAECEYAMDVDYQPESDARGYERTKVDKDGNVITTKSDKYQHSLAGLPKLPTNGYYKYRTNPNPDTVPWVITGQMKVKRLLSDAEVNAILEKNGIEPIHRQGGDKTLAELGLKESLGEDWYWDDDGYFSHEQLMEFGSEFEDALQARHGKMFEVGGVFFEKDNTLEVDIYAKPYGDGFTVSQKVDMRRVKTTKDLNKYISALLDKASKQIVDDEY